MDFDPTELDRLHEGVGLYVHIPFCDVRCPYCHFYCFVNKDEALPLRFVTALRTQFARYREAGLLDGGLRSLYFGGGTPSALRGTARDALCAFVADELSPLFLPGAERTMEANPESVGVEELRPWVQAGIDRVSLGLQSMHPPTLEFLGRLNTPESNRRALESVASLVDRISIDLIVGTPGSSWAQVEAGLDEIFRWPVGHVSAYLLEIHETTRFGRDFAAGRLTPQPDDEQCAQYLALVDALEARGLIAYELSNFARPGQEARHNRIYWQRAPYLGLGPSAHSFAQERRWWNVADAARYCGELEAGGSGIEAGESIGAAQRRDEELLLGLRTAEGLPRQLLAGKAALVERFTREGWMRSEGDRLRMTPTGWLLLDSLVAQLAQ